MPSEVRVLGLKELHRAFALVSAELKKELRDELKDIAEPVRARAEELAREQIGNIGSAWPRMRIGVTTSIVYVAPTSRRRGGSPRPNLAGLLATKAMEPALAEQEDKIVGQVDDLIGKISDTAGFGRGVSI